METLLRPQEPAVPQEPAQSTDPHLGSRAWSWYTERYLPYAESDPRIQRLARAAMREKVLNGPAALEKLSAYSPQDQEAAMRHIQAFEDTYSEAQKNPLRATTIFRETGADRRLFDIASGPQGMDIISDLAKQADDGEIYRVAQDSLNMANLARIGQVALAGETLDPEGVSGLPALARGGISWADEIAKSVQDAKDSAAMDAMDMRRPISRSIQNRQAVNAEYQSFAYEFGESLARGAAKVGVVYAGPQAAPKNVADAKRIFLEALPIAEQVQEKVIGVESKDLGLYGPENARRSMGLYAKTLYAVQQKMPEKGGDLAEIQQVLEAYAAGESVEGNPVADVALATLKPAFWVLEKMGRLDQATNAILYGTTGTTAPVRFRFADGSVFSDMFSAAEYSQKIIAQGGVYQSPQSLIDRSAESRLGALFDEAVAAEFPVPGKREPGFFATMGRAIQGGIGLMQEGVRRAGDAIMGGAEEIDPRLAARPVVEYGVTVLPDGGSTVDWGEIGSALWDGDGQFIGDTIRENTSTKSDQDLGYRATGWVLAEAPTVILSPWNLAGTNQVTARTVNEAKERLLGEVAGEVAGASSGAPRVYRFTDGRQMNAEWSAVREKVASDLGAGGAGDLGGSGDMADVLLTELRDAPGQTYDEIVTRFKNRPGFLDEMGFLAEQSGLAPWVGRKAAGYSQAEYLAGRNKAVAESLEEALAKAKPVIEQAPLTFGYKDFWTDPGSRAWKMQAKRGIYFGPVGVPLGPISQRLGQATAGIAERAAHVPVLREILRPVSALRRATASVFLTSHVGTQTPAMGTAGAVQDAIKIPYRMRKAFERQYRLQAATLDARALMSTSDLLDDAGSLVGEADRKLVTILAESGRTVEDQARALLHHADVYGDAVGWRPQGATQAEQMASALGKARSLFTTTSRVQNYLDATFRDLSRMGVLDDVDYVRDYVTHFYHGPAGAKALRPVEDLVAELEKRRAAEQAIPSQLNRGTTAIPRVGPESVIEAMRLGGFKPELDIARLLHFRTTHALKAELDAAFMGRIARTFGTPMLRGKEAAVRLAQAVRGSQRLSAELGYGSALLTRDAYRTDLAEVSKLIRDKSAQLDRQALGELAQELGIPLSKFLDEKMLVGSMMNSDTFLRRAASGRKGSLDKMVNPETRKALREISREMLVHKENLRVAGLALRDLGIELPHLETLSDVELALVAQKASQAIQQRVGRLPAVEKDLKIARSALTATQAESRLLGQRLKELAESSVKLVKERDQIGKAWDKAKKAAADAGLVADDLATAKDLSQVRRATIFSSDIAKHDAAFAAYKKAQAEYVANAQARKQTEQAFDYWRGQSNRQKSFLAKAKARLEAHEAAARRTKDRARILDKQRRAAGRVGISFRSELDKTVDGLMESSRAYLEARRAANGLLSSGKAHGVALSLRGAAKRLAAHGQSVRSALGSFASKHGVDEQVARRRALTPRTIQGAGGALKRQQEAMLRPPAPFEKKPLTPSFVPARDQGELLEYARAQEGLDALEMSRSEQSALLWEVFGARTLTEVPMSELRMLTDSSGPMRASILRFIVDPFGDATRQAVRRMDVGPDSPAVRVGRALGVSMTGTGEEIQENIERALSKVIADAEKGSERAQRVLNAIPASDLAKVYSYEDLGRAAKAVISEDKEIRNYVATLSAKDRGALERQLRTTFIPLELGLAMKTLMGEGVFKKSEAARIALATRFGDALASILQRFAPITRGFKTAAIGYRASMLPGRRNSLFDGVRAMTQLGAWSFFSRSARKSFLTDIRSPGGKIQTATGLVDRQTFQQIWEERGAAMFGANADSLEATSRTLANSMKAAQSKRFIKELQEVGQEGRRTTGVNIPRGAVKSAAVGGALGEALTDDLASGAAVGFGFYGFLSGATGLRRTVHSSGQIATHAEWLMPVGPQAIERLENTFRYFVYWSYVKSGMAPADAMDLMLRRMRDMTNMTPAERSIVQHLASAAPFMFYNFTKQNGIAQLVRFLDNPTPTVHLLRTISDLSDSYAQDEDARAFWQNITDTIVKGGKGWNMQDETTAALDLLAPVTGLIEGAFEGRPMTGLRAGLAALGDTGQSAPIWKVLAGESGEVSLPLPLASKILEEHGPFHGYGMRAYYNEQGVPRVELASGMGIMTTITGATVALNDVGRLQMGAERGDWAYTIGEALGMGRIYDQQSALEVQIDRFNAQEKKVMEAADWLEANEISGDTLMDAIGLTPEEKSVTQEILRYQSGKYIADQVSALRARFRALQGKNRKALAGRLPVPENN